MTSDSGNNSTATWPMSQVIKGLISKASGPYAQQRKPSSPARVWWQATLRGSSNAAPQANSMSVPIFFRKFTGSICRTLDLRSTFTELPSYGRRQLQQLCAKLLA